MGQIQLTKESGWEKIINDNFTEIFGGGKYSDTGWVTAGITFINGASKGDGTPKFRTITQGKLGMTFLSIPVVVPALGAGAVSNVVQLPDTAQVPNAESDFGGYSRTGQNKMMIWGRSANSQLFVNCIDAWTTNNQMEINGFFIFTVK